MLLVMVAIPAAHAQNKVAATIKEVKKVVPEVGNVDFKKPERPAVTPVKVFVPEISPVEAGKFTRTPTAQVVEPVVPEVASVNFVKPEIAKPVGVKVVVPQISTDIESETADILRKLRSELANEKQ